MFQAIRNYFSEPARASRKRAKERQELTAELRGIRAMRVVGYEREDRILKRLRVLDHVEAAAKAEASGASVPERRKAYRLVEPAPAHVIEDEVLRELRLVPRDGYITSASHWPLKSNIVVQP